jgi:hypothetical protein
MRYTYTIILTRKGIVYQDEFTGNIFTLLAYIMKMRRWKVIRIRTQKIIT